ncbi:hypothetical protein X975_15489, partial [Stegodyphus mimosarum]
VLNRSSKATSLLTQTSRRLRQLIAHVLACDGIMNCVRSSALISAIRREKRKKISKKGVATVWS